MKLKPKRYPDELFERSGPGNVEFRSPDELHANPDNARTHSIRNIKKLEKIMGSTRVFVPIIIDENDVILAGHARVLAAKRLGLTEVPTLRYAHLTPAQKLAYMIADNRVAEEAGWDHDILAVNFSQLVQLMPTEGLDISVTGFDPAEIDQLLTNMNPSPVGSETPLPPLPKVAVTVPEDIWVFGQKHRLLCGDAQKASSFNRLMNGSTAAAVFCDIPYNLPVRSIGGRGKTKHSEFAFASGEMSREQFRKFMAVTSGNAARFSADGAVHFACIDWRHVDVLIDVGREIYGEMLNLVVWNKSNAGQGSFYRSQHELIGVFRVGKGPHRNNVELGRFGRNRSNVWNYPGMNSFGRGRMTDLASHPTVKPTAMVVDALLDCTVRGDVVLDQFAGSGTIFLAAERAGRIAYGMEIEPRYVDVAIQRWQALTKLDVTLEGDGRTFEEIAEARAKTRSDAERAATASAPPKRSPARSKLGNAAPAKPRRTPKMGGSRG
jgi:DNA modification methylase